ncbi:NAD(P)/FAD-dependent oxidoreductase [Blautia argi]|uniref:Thioredoxin reductase n=1 Tax=Blautia argi TaxID=1912897 RepID=A0A2Z4U9D6_9FIRM|nr:FAD-dependent oxidoreductase [Blautia argi]AWY97429.1 thioredoxin reductase [Blautia argi]
MYDVVIIGAGPAGISAAIYAVSRGKKTLVIERTQVGGLIGRVSAVTHYAGITEGETGVTFSEKLKAQAERANIELVYETVVSVKLSGEKKEIQTKQHTYEAAKVILANGTSPRKLGIVGEAELCGKGMSMNAAQHGMLYRGKNVYVVGGADGAVKEALYLAQYAAQVTIIHFEETLGCIAEFKEKVVKTPNIKLRLNSRLHGVYGTEKVNSLEISNERTGAIETIEDSGCGIFVYAGTVPNTELYTELRLENGFIPVDENMETELPGVYAAGDIRVKQVRQVSTAVADGTIAAVHAAR